MKHSVKRVPRERNTKLENIKILKGYLNTNYNNLKTYDDVLDAIKYMVSSYQYPVTVLQSLNQNLLDAPNDLSYAKQQLRYLLNCVVIPA